VGTFAQRALPRLSANPGLPGHTGPHHSRRGRLNTSSYIGDHTRRHLQEPIPPLAWLLANRCV